MSRRLAPAFLLDPSRHMETNQVLRMTYEAQGVYWRLLGRMWKGSDDQSSIEIRALPGVLGLSGRRLKRLIGQILWAGDPLLVERDGRYVSPYLEGLKAEWDAVIEAKAEGGRMTAQKNREKSAQHSAVHGAEHRALHGGEHGAEHPGDHPQTTTTTTTTRRKEPPPEALPGEGGPGEEGEGCGTEGSDGPPAAPPPRGGPGAPGPGGETAAPPGADPGPDALLAVNFRRSEGLLQELGLKRGFAHEIALTVPVGRVFRVVLEARKQRRPSGWARRAFEQDYAVPAPEGPDLEAEAQLARDLEAESRARDEVPTPPPRRPAVDRLPGESDRDYLLRGQEAIRARRGLRAVDGKGRKAEA